MTSVETSLSYEMQQFLLLFLEALTLIAVVFVSIVPGCCGMRRRSNRFVMGLLMGFAVLILLILDGEWVLWRWGYDPSVPASMSVVAACLVILIPAVVILEARVASSLALTLQRKAVRGFTRSDSGGETKSGTLSSSSSSSSMNPAGRCDSFRGLLLDAALAGTVLCVLLSAFFNAYYLATSRYLTMSVGFLVAAGCLQFVAVAMVTCSVRAKEVVWCKCRVPVDCGDTLLALLALAMCVAFLALFASLLSTGFDKTYLITVDCRAAYFPDGRFSPDGNRRVFVSFVVCLSVVAGMIVWLTAAGTSPSDLRYYYRARYKIGGKAPRQRIASRVTQV